MRLTAVSIPGGLLRAAWLALAILLPVPTAWAMEVATARGPVRVDGAPGRIAVFDIAAVDTLARLGIRPDGLPDRLYVSDLDALAARAARVGTIHEPDLEALSALGPDLVIVGGRSSPWLDQVRRVAPAIDMTIDGRDLLAQALARLASYGALFGRQAEADADAAELDAAVLRARDAIRGKGTGLIVMANGPKVSAYGAGSRFGWIHTDLGLPPAVPELNGAAVHGEAVSFEFIRKADPDWLLVLDRAVAIGEAGAKAGSTLANELVAQTSAARQGRIVHLPPADVYIAAGGITATLRALARIEAAFRAVP